MSQATSTASNAAGISSPLRILTGVEFGQPHLFEEQAAQLLDLAMLDRVNGSLHTLPTDDDRSEPNTLFRLWPAENWTAYSVAGRRVEQN
ncbi:hypothetical protein [Nocardia gipuzkoensis]|uniref:hypothetical protein n=1 Tax=Nocardia gipuzkoensis TaxID=2749991 RepID=UPI001F18EEC4|nr:hypothetical protein [Nocardia gipuzkoensis]